MSLPTEADTPVADMDAKLMVATGSGGVQQLKDLVNKQEEQDSEVMLVVLAKTKQAASPGEMPHRDPHLLALASSRSFEELKSLLVIVSEEGQASSDNGGKDDDIEANKSILSGVTAEGNTALHVAAAACGQGDNFLKSARIIHKKDKDLLFAQNSNGDTPLHCAARAGKYDMVNCLIHLAFDEGGEGKMNALLRKQNKDKGTALLEAVRIGNNHIVDLLMDKDSELASIPEDGGTSPMYLAIVLKRDEIVKILYDKSSPGKLSFAGPNRQNALHAAVLRYPNRYRHRDLTKLLGWNETHLCPQNKDLTTQGDENGSTPLHFAAPMEVPYFEYFSMKSWIEFERSSICRQVLEANVDALYQPDHAGSFPIHVAASAGASENVGMFVTKCPGSAGVRDAKGRTFLHVAVEKRKVNVIRSACSNLSLSWIMNMVDNDGNTALHLAVEVGRLQMFCPLVGNPQVELSLPNNKGETPLDIAEYNIHGFHYNQGSEAQICRTLRLVGGLKGVRRLDPLENNTTARVKHDESKETEALRDSTATLCIGSVLIATVTFGATFPVPGGYIADDHNHGGSPILARRYAFDAFIASNTLAFVFSAMATISLMYSGSPMVNPRGRGMHLRAAVYLLWISITSLAAAFALGAYVVLAPVSHKTAVATCVLTSLVLLYKHLDIILGCLLLLPPLSTRKGLIWAWVSSAYVILANMLHENWPLIFIFGWAAHAKPADIQNRSSCTDTSTITYNLEARGIDQQIYMWSRQ